MSSSSEGCFFSSCIQISWRTKLTLSPLCFLNTIWCAFSHHSSSTFCWGQNPMGTLQPSHAWLGCLQCDLLHPFLKLLPGYNSSHDSLCARLLCLSLSIPFHSSSQTSFFSEWSLCSIYTLSPEASWSYPQLHLPPMCWWLPNPYPQTLPLYWALNLIFPNIECFPMNFSPYLTLSSLSHMFLLSELIAQHYSSHRQSLWWSSTLLSIPYYPLFISGFFFLNTKFLKVALLLPFYYFISYLYYFVHFTE